MNDRKIRLLDAKLDFGINLKVSLLRRGLCVRRLGRGNKEGEQGTLRRVKGKRDLCHILCESLVGFGVLWLLHFVFIDEECDLVPVSLGNTAPSLIHYLAEALAFSLFSSSPARPPTSPFHFPLGPPLGSLCGGEEHKIERTKHNA